MTEAQPPDGTPAPRRRRRRAVRPPTNPSAWDDPDVVDRPAAEDEPDAADSSAAADSDTMHDHWLREQRPPHWE